MSKDSKNIIVTAGSAVGSGLELIRSIKRKENCKSYVLCTNERTNKIYQVSKYVDEAHFIKNSETEEAYVESIKKWHASKTFSSKPILYFTADTHCFYINNHREWFEERFELCLPSSHITKTYTQKGLAEVDARNNGLTVPKTQVVETKDDIDYVVAQFSFPVIIKPRATYLSSNINFKIKVINDKVEFLLETTKLIKENNTLLCQEFIPGDDNTSFYYLFYRGKDGTIYDNIGRKTLQSTPNGGVMVKGLVEYNNKLAQICHDFLNKIDYKGIGGIEFKKYNGKFYFIEMSTRLEGFFKIAEISNTPLSLLSYFDLSNLEEPKELEKTKQQDGIVYMDFISMLVVRIKNRKFLSLICDVYSAVLSPKTKLNVFSNSDSKPFFLTLRNLITR